MRITAETMGKTYQGLIPATITLFLAVFKEEAAAAKAWGDAHANAVGRARMDMEKYLASMQDTFVPPK